MYHKISPSIFDATGYVCQPEHELSAFEEEMAMLMCLLVKVDFSITQR
jgi:hypothetical protein